VLSVLDGGGAPRRLQRLSSYRKKFVVFAVELHCAAFPTIPLFPLSLELLMEFCVWASRNGVNGFDSISNYVGDVVTWAMQTCDQPDPRSATPLAARTWATFVSNFPKVVGAPPSKVKLRLQAGHLESMFLDMTDASWSDRRDRAAYLTLWYSACRIGHVAPDAADPQTLGHALRWDGLKFEPSLEAPERVLLYFPSTKTRPLLANRPWWTAVGRVDDESVCLVSVLRLHFLEHYTGRPSDFVFTRAPDDGRHYTRTAFTDILRYRLVGAARHLGIDIDVKAFSGISFRKGSLQTAADVGTPGYALADLGDHSSVDMTRFYVGDTVAGRAARTAAIGGGFDGVSPARPALGPALPQFGAPDRLAVARR
jgi:hypothetical protein